MKAHDQVKQHLPEKWEDFLRILINRLSKTSPSLPTVRCLTRKTLVGVFRDIEKELCLPSTFPTGIKILNTLISMGLATQIPVKETVKSAPSNEFYLMGFQGSHEREIDPLELLQAFSQEGIICYLSALGHLELTTQVPVHHHIAIPTREGADLIKEPLETVRSLDPSGETPKRSKLGTRIFSYEGIPYYSTKRVRSSIPGIKERVLSPWSTIRMTTIEQTLLDTLQYPYHCGGPEVVFEAWQTAQDRYEEEALLEGLKRIGLPPLIRRLGAVYNLLNYMPSKCLGAFLKEKRDQFFTQSENPPIPLLRGLTFSQLDSYWNVLVP
jgi:predicted transcriptional regulator of viral defense system